MTIKSCRFCGALLNHRFVDLGSTPLANSYLTAEMLDKVEPRYPLRAFVCSECWLVQADEVVAAKSIFSDYAYFSSFSDSWVDHAKRFAAMATTRFGLGGDSQVIEVASNDGYLLKHFVANNVPSLGIEPARNVAKVALSIGVPTETSFFGRDVAQDLVTRGMAADLVVGNNVLAHVPDINDFVRGLATVIKSDGVVSVEFPHLLKLIEDVQFDTIYHEHFYYLSLLAVEHIFAAHGLRVFDVEELPTHGGSLRVFAASEGDVTHDVGPSLAKVRMDEERAGFSDTKTYESFHDRVAPVKDGLLAFLQRAKQEGKHVVAYGAAAKGNTLLNFSGVESDLISYVVDRSPYKQGHYLPGSRLPILPPEKLNETRPDYILILPWNIKDEVIASVDAAKWGGRFVIAVPQLSVLE